MALQEGSKAPDFKLIGDDGKEHSLGEFKSKILVLYFYPKDFTSGCTAEACSFRDSSSEIIKLGAQVIGISKDDSESHKKFAGEYHLNFPILADTEGKVTEAYGVWGEKSMYGKKFMGIVRSTFIIDKNGNIAKVFSPVKVEGHTEEVIEALKKM